MLKANCKAALENIRNYIIINADFSNYDYSEADEAQAAYIAGEKDQKQAFPIIAHTIYNEFHIEKSADKRRISDYDLFEEWVSGLPSILDTCYYYNRSAVDDLGMILEETDAEKATYTERKAEAMLTSLIYRQISKY